jgi:hypothetical protein
MHSIKLQKARSSKLMTYNSVITPILTCTAETREDISRTRHISEIT